MANNKIVFVLPGMSPTATGGAKMVFLYANHLVALGCDVTICFDYGWRHFESKAMAMLAKAHWKLNVMHGPVWFSLDKRVHKRCIVDISDSSMPDADHVVATSVGSAGPIAALSASKGKKHYFIQGYETWDLPCDEVEATYRLGMSNIVVSDWLAEIVERASGLAPHKVKNPIDDALFYPLPCKRHAHEIAVLYHPGEYKGFADAYAALEIVHMRIPDLVVNVFGGPERPTWLPGWCRYTQNADESLLRALYSRSSIFLCASVNEGFGLTCPEAMYCGCALVATNFQGVYEYANEDCALLSPIHAPELLADNLTKLLENPDEARRIAALGMSNARKECSLSRAYAAIESEFEVS